MADVDGHVEQLLAEREIRARLIDYCRGIDTCDAALVASVYHPGARDDHGRFTGDGHEFAVYATKALRQHYRATMHSIGESRIVFESDAVATVETYVTAQHVGCDDAGEFVEHYGGDYRDRFERRDEVWKIADRTFVHRWDKKEHVQPAVPAGTFVEAERIDLGPE